MLEHGANAEEGGSGKPQPDFYTPPRHPEPLSGAGAAPAVKRFNRKMLAGATVVGVIVTALALTVGLKQLKAPVATPETATGKAPLPNAKISALPNSYSSGVPQLGEPRPGDVGAIPSGAVTGGGAGVSRALTAFEQYEEERELERRRNVDRAQSAGLLFANAGNADAGAPAGIAAPSDGSDVESRLIHLAEHPGSTSSVEWAHQDPNHQDEKLAFAEKTRGTDFDLHASVMRARSPYTLFAGTILPCVLMQGIDSDLPGQIGCLISQNVYDTVSGNHLLLPQGTKAIGVYDSHLGYGQERVLVVWTRLLRPDGSSLSLEGMPGVDLSGYAGLTGHVNNHYFRLLSGVVLGSLLGASAQIAVGANSSNPSFAELAVQGAGQNINEAGQQITRRNLNIQPSIDVRPGTRLNIFATKDLILPPWVN